MNKAIFFILIISMFSCSCVYNNFYLENGKYSKNDSIDFIDLEEGLFLNKIANMNGEKCDLRLKKVAFFSGNVGTLRVNKYRFFSCCDMYRQIQSDAYPVCYFYFFNKDEQEKTKGYYAAIVYGSLKKIPKKKYIVRRIRNRIRNQQV